MKIGLISDTHGYMDAQILDVLGQADEIWHAGDIGEGEVMEQLAGIAPIKAVHGNIDTPALRERYPEDLVFELSGLKVVITHIGGYPGRYSKHGRELIRRHSPGLFICGHSHILKVMPDSRNHLLHINPGAAGQQGFHKVRTLIRFEINEGKPENLEIVELGKRGQLP